MKTEIKQEIEIPSGISAKLENGVLILSKGSNTASRNFTIPKVSTKLVGNKVVFTSKGNKNELKKIMSSLAHIKNMYSGLDKKFVFKLQSCNVHFPMTLKIDKNMLIINNFLGEKTPRYAEILPNVDVKIAAQNITISSYDREAAGHTASNFEKATKIKERDRRVFQDGIYIVEKTVEESK